MSEATARNKLNRKIAAAIGEFESATGVGVYRIQFDVDFDDDYNSTLIVDAVPHGEFIGPHDAVKAADH